MFRIIDNFLQIITCLFNSMFILLYFDLHIMWLWFVRKYNFWFLFIMLYFLLSFFRRLIFFSQFCKLNLSELISREIFPRTFIAHIASTLTFTETISTNDGWHVCLINFLKHVFEWSSLNMDLLPCFLINKWLEHFVASSENQGTVDDEHFMHDFWIIVLTHGNSNFNKVDCLFVERRHWKSLHVQATKSSVDSFTSSFWTSWQPPMNQFFIFHQVVSSHFLLARQIKKLINNYLSRLFKVKWPSLSVSFVVAMIVPCLQ